MPGECSRRWEAEALEDGRLGGADRESFLRHTRACAACRNEIDALTDVRERLASLPVPQATRLEHLRQRAKLLQSANAVAVPIRRSTPWIASAAVGLVFVAGAAVALRLASQSAPETASADPAQAPKHEHAGELWPEPEPTSSAAPQPSSARPPSDHAVHAPKASASQRAPSPAAGELFDEGVASFRASAYEDADRQLARFAREFPKDPRCEDAMYLRAVARWRLGDRDGAAELAKSYLDAYPNGLRRPEAERMRAPRVDGTVDGSPR